jgi:hypothetical protein
MNSLRAKLKPTLRNQDIVFDVSGGGAYKTSGDWVFLRGKIQLRGTTRPVDYHGTAYQEDIDANLSDDGFGALFHKENGKFDVKAVAINPTDVAWTGWDTEYGAPSDIFR